jgi:hypothetical protein
VLFPNGLDSKASLGLLTVLEMARTLFLDTISRHQVQPLSIVEDSKVPTVEEKKTVSNFFGGLFGKKKVG